MTNILVCIKRVPDTSGDVQLSEDGMTIDARHLGHTLSAHEECAIAIAAELAASSDGMATALSLGAGDAQEQLRHAVALGCGAAILLEAEPDSFGPADVAQAIAAVVRDRKESGAGFDLILLGTDAADTGDFQVAVRLAYQLNLPVLTGIVTVGIDGDTVTARGTGPDGTEVYELPMPAVIAIQEGGVEPRYPSIPGRMRAKRTEIETLPPAVSPRGSGRVRLTLPPAHPGTVKVLGEDATAAPALVDVLSELGVVSK
ncbi:electron transfer flavoprotein subunit beta/FixA family protein [Saxibacter everestensis]|uniref:Electron transfer flavoprotein subunit beta/FixA family protein n=1 Tax=Saxibacter everestensis TaxID=2909229 RepID=A0ABY8QXA1_9MICO|nr:electron transfer flavoprotein subunit beta/FixA family protein [Brevibacteriaceae bacterium ZFBP1038]